MLGLMRVVGLGLVGLVVLMVLREENRALTLVLRVALAAAILLMIVPDVGRVVADLVHLSELAEIPAAYLALLLKVVGIAYVTVFMGQLAADSGETHMGARVELAGKVVILLLAIPLIASITETVLKMIPS
ncbi:MAG: stage III sporulation protein AD [Firmicutes bacterium]|nr:stage III sporulation protein AD [Bacillota bacterium]